MRDPEFQLDLDFIDADDEERPGSKPDLWQRMSRVMEGTLYLLIIAAVMRLFWPEIEHQRELNAQQARIDEVRKERQAYAAQLQLKFELLRTDREYIEAVARDRLDLFRPGEDEFVVRIQRPEEDASETAE